MVKNLDVPKDNSDKKYTVTIPVNEISVEGILRIPHNPRGDSFICSWKRQWQT